MSTPPLSPEQDRLLVRFFSTNRDHLATTLNDAYYTNIFPYVCRIIVQNNPEYVKLVETIMENFHSFTTMYQMREEKFQAYLESYRKPGENSSFVEMMLNNSRKENIEKCFARNPDNGERIRNDDGTYKEGMLEEHPQFFLHLNQALTEDSTLPQWMIEDIQPIIQEIRKNSVELENLSMSQILFYEQYWYLSDRNRWFNHMIKKTIISMANADITKKEGDEDSSSGDEM
jgi:hypothetical protein